MEKDRQPHRDRPWTAGSTPTLVYQGLLAAGPKFDRKKVIDATNEMTEFTAGGLIPPIDWTRQHEAPDRGRPRPPTGPSRSAWPRVEVIDGEFEIVGDRDEAVLLLAR